MTETHTPPSLTAIHVPARDIPPPGSISKAAQAVLSSLAAVPAISYPKPDDLDGWHQMILAREAKWDPWISETLASSSCRTERYDCGGVIAYVSTPPNLEGSAKDRAYLYVHGGAFVFGAGRFAMAFGAMTAQQLGLTTISVDYRMPPDHPYPAAPLDCVAVYKELIKAYDPRHLIIGGGSSGGNIAAAAILMIRDQGLPLPAAAALLTPAIDLTESGDSFQTNELLDVVLKCGLPECVALYADGHDLGTSYLSPLFDDFLRGFPPTFIQSGTRDVFLSNSVRLHRKLRRAGVSTELHVWESMPHGGFGVDLDVPENDEINEELRQFVARYC